MGYITILLYYYITTLLHYYITTLLYYYITILLYYYTIILLYYYTTILLYYDITTLLYFACVYVSEVIAVQGSCGPRLLVDHRSEVLKMAGSSRMSVEGQIRAHIIILHITTLLHYHNYCIAILL